MTLEQIAELTHEANRVYCQMHGDNSQPVWSEAPEWQKKSAINGVMFHQGNPTAGDSASHENWMMEKVNDGWRYGETKDPTLKTHPCIMPFEDLPKIQQAKDRLFRSIVHACIDP